MAIQRRVRKGQVITPFGPGGIFDFGDESFMALDISQWKTQATSELRSLPRLMNMLGVFELREPKSVSETKEKTIDIWNSIPYMRFPAWMFCPRCRGMQKLTWNDEEKGTAPTCRNCGPNSKLAPMRFIQVCENGHIADVDWIKWAHHKSSSSCESFDLEFVSDPRKGSGLASLSVVCKSCKKGSSLEDIASKDALKFKGLGRCSGRHPWQNHANAVKCDCVPQVVQRGASNAYFPSTISALDIQNDGEGLDLDWVDAFQSHPRYVFLKMLWDTHPDPSNQALQIVCKEIATDLSVGIDDILGQLKVKDSSVPEDSEILEASISTEQKLKLEEWLVLNAGNHTTSQVFSAEPVDLDQFVTSLPSEEHQCWSKLERLLDKLVLARRIRIVRAFTGFRRLDPAAPLVRANFNTARPEWLPATEVFGEGIYLSLSPEALKAWEARVGSRATSGIKSRQDNSSLGQSLPEATPRYVLLHTLAHLLIRQLCFECGYSSSSLAERIYCDDQMAGILIYTASGDSEGALGGLVREGEPDRFYGILKTALYRGRWCSNDPICSELPFQGYAGMNRAACHACTLLGETSCETANSLLDRRLIYGDNELEGFFSEFLDAMEVSL